MKALSIKQPWAWLILKGYKAVENRRWSTKRRGRILVHAGQKIDQLAYHTYRLIYRDMPEKLPTGCIVGEVTVTSCRAIDPNKPETIRTSFDEGPYGFDLADPELYAKPIPYSGALGFFEVDTDTLPQHKDEHD